MTFNLPLLRMALIGVLLTTGSAIGHEGHDHGDAAKAQPPAATPSRLESASGAFELVALLQKGELHLYLDRFASNAPICRCDDLCRNSVRTRHRGSQRGRLSDRRAVGKAGLT